VLIDGDRLAELMVRHGVGVQAKSAAAQHRGDEGFFETLLIPSVRQEGGNMTNLDPKIVTQVSERLGNYVYLLVDPRDSRPFYVGKGVGVRMTAHELEAKDADGETDSRKLLMIKEISDAGEHHEIWVVRYRLTKSEYTAVEAAVIDVLGSFPVKPRGSAVKYRPLVLRDELTNMRREDAKGKGMILRDRLVDELAAPLLATTEPLLLITLAPWGDKEEGDRRWTKSGRIRLQTRVVRPCRAR
jgi:hypothetical protein